MKLTKVVVLWPDGLHLRHAVKLMKAAAQFQSTVRLKCGDKIADVRSIISLIALCATIGTTLEVEVSGADEADATQTVEQIFLA